MAGPLTALDGFILTMTSCFASHGLRNLLLEACFDISYPADIKSVQSIGDPTLLASTERRIRKVN